MPALGSHHTGLLPRPARSGGIPGGSGVLEPRTGACGEEQGQGPRGEGGALWGRSQELRSHGSWNKPEMQDEVDQMERVWDLGGEEGENMSSLFLRGAGRLRCAAGGGVGSAEG